MCVFIYHFSIKGALLSLFTEFRGCCMVDGRAKEKKKKKLFHIISTRSGKTKFSNQKRLDFLNEYFNKCSCVFVVLQ
jgi:hypothetical protein